jgi:hypothetical protein
MSIPNSASNVVSTVALVLERFLANIREEIPDVKIVYDEALSYESALEAFRASNNIPSQPVKSNFYPMLIFKRSVLRYAKDGNSHRSIVDRVRRNMPEPSKDAQVYRGLHGEFDFQFLYVTKTMEDFERFEIAYLSEESFSEDREIIVDATVPITGTNLAYYLSPHPLEDRTISSEGNFYKAVTGSITIRGYYLVFRENLKIVESIRMRIMEFNQNILTQKIIT